MIHAPIDYALAHCVAKDFLMGAGIAVEFKKRYGSNKFYYTKKEVCQLQVLQKERLIFYIVTKEKKLFKTNVSKIFQMQLSLYTTNVY